LQYWLSYKIALNLNKPDRKFPLNLLPSFAAENSLQKEQDKKDKNKFSIFFNRPILRDKALKIAEIKLQTAYNKVKIKFNSIYQFLELMIVTFISFRLINGKAKYKSERDKKIPKCVFRRISKNLKLVEC